MKHPSALIAALLISAVALAGCIGGAASPAYTPITRDITLWVEQMSWEVHPGIFTTVWAFCGEGDGVEPVHEGACGVPGPTIRVKKGDTVRIQFTNDHAIPHTVHFHGWHPTMADMNGNSILGEHMVTQPGQTHIIEWVAQPSGSFIYHCHFDTPTHMEMGMYGAFIVEDPEATAADVDVPLVIDEWQIRDDPADIRFNGNMPAYNFFTMNGKSFPLTAPIVAEKGDTVRIHLVNAGYEFHAMHIHGYTPTAYEGVAGPRAGVLTDVREIAPGQTIVMDFVAEREGVWLMHDHVVPRVTAGSDGHGFGAYPRGMLTMVIVGEKYLEAVVAAVPGLIAAARGDGAESAAPGTHPSDGAGRVTNMKDFAFEEQELRVAVGTTVTWANRDAALHTVTSAEGLFDSGNVQAGQSWSHTFTEAGTYNIYCKPHAHQKDGVWQGMVATVVVGASA